MTHHQGAVERIVGLLEEAARQEVFSILVENPDARALLTAYQATEARNKELEGALEPFVNAAEEARERYPEAGSAYVREEACSHLTWDDFVSAHVLLRPKPSLFHPTHDVIQVDKE